MLKLGFAVAIICAAAFLAVQVKRWWKVYKAEAELDSARVEGEALRLANEAKRQRQENDGVVGGESVSGDADSSSSS